VDVKIQKGGISIHRGDDGSLLKRCE